MSNMTGNSFRLANTWSPKWADGGTAYGMLAQYMPKEVWLPHYTIVPDRVQKQLDARASKQGQLLDLMQKVLLLMQRLVTMRA